MAIDGEQKLAFTAVAGWVLQNRRESKAWSQAYVGSNVGVSQAGWAKIEKGLVPISLPQLVRFSRMLNEPTERLIEDIEYAVEKCEAAKKPVVFERPPLKVSDAAASFLLGAALGGLLTTLLLKKD